MKSAHTTTLRAPSAHFHTLPSTAEGTSAGSTTVAPASAIFSMALSKALAIVAEAGDLLCQFWRYRSVRKYLVIFWVRWVLYEGFRCGAL